MNVLVVTNMYPSAVNANAGLFVAREVDGLRATGLDVDVVHVDTVTRRWRYLSAIPAAAGRIRSRRPDLVHVHYGLSQIFSFTWKGPSVVTFHGTDLAVPWQRSISHGLLKRSAEVIVVSSRMLSQLPPGRSASVISCGVPTDRFRPMPRQEARARLGLTSDALVVGFPSSPSRVEKDHALFRAVCDGLASEGRPLVAVAFDGVQPDDVPCWLAALDVLLMTSRREGSPVITREALCCGTRVVSTDVGDVREQIAGLSGCVVAGREPADLAEAVREAMRQQPPDADEAAARFGMAREIELVRSVYDRAIAGACACAS